MALFCRLGLHAWDGCQCTRCGAQRDEGHVWEVTRCVKCGKMLPTKPVHANVSAWEVSRSMRT